MSNRILPVIGVALLLATAGCVGGFAPTDAAGAQEETTQAPGSNDGGGSTIGVVATGQAAAEPDQALVQVSVLARADDANVVRESLAENASQMREALAEIGIDDDSIRTVNYAIDQDYRERNGERVPDGFQGVHAFEVTLSNVSEVGSVVDAAVANGADRVERVELTLSEERRREVRADALRDAMENARGNAEVIAESADLTVSGVRSASTGDLSFSPVRAETLQADAAGGRAPTNIESGPVTVTAQVDVTYNATR
ncbi:SIMPL domain-containing protein [Halorussus litoreus]|uniref:SIMPL domain-containing protein n=1 Tax=Halorussus litoreus TaxID=1710536 RepID=UPI000E25117B|nr:SIMPL domain-containing protein [Halorussus litoreus]